MLFLEKMESIHLKILSVTRILLLNMDLCYVSQNIGNIGLCKELYHGARNAVVILISLFAQHYPLVYEKELKKYNTSSLKSMWEENRETDSYERICRDGFNYKLRSLFEGLWQVYREEIFTQKHPFELELREVPFYIGDFFRLSSSLNDFYKDLAKRLGIRKEKGLLFAEGLKYPAKLEKARLQNGESLSEVFKVYLTEATTAEMRVLNELKELISDIKVGYSVSVYAQNQNSVFGYGVTPCNFYPQIGGWYKQSLMLVDGLDSSLLSGLKDLHLFCDESFEEIFKKINTFQKIRLKKSTEKVHKILFEEYYRKRVYKAIANQSHAALLQMESIFESKDVQGSFFTVGCLARFHLAFVSAVKDVIEFFEFIEKFALKTNDGKIKMLKGMTDIQKKILADYKQYAKFVHETDRHTFILGKKESDLIVNKYKANPVRIVVDIQQLRKRVIQKMACSQFAVQDVEVQDEKEKQFDGFVRQSFSDKSCNMDVYRAETIPDTEEDITSCLKHYLRL